MLARHANDSGSGSSHTLDLLISLLCLPLKWVAAEQLPIWLLSAPLYYRLRIDQNLIWAEGWTPSWHTLFATAYARSEARRLSYFASIVEPICQSILANESSRSSIM